MSNRETETRRRIGVLGGSFDPIHVAHLIMAETVREALDLELVLFVPVSEQPLKRAKKATLAAHRVAMVERAIAGNAHFALSRVDVERDGPSYTADTLELLRREWPVAGWDMWFILGADSLLSLPLWRDPQRVLSYARLAALQRPSVSVDLSLVTRDFPQLDANLDWVEAPLLEISATDIRKRVSEGRSIQYRVTEAVRNYIEENGLYKG